MNYKVALAGIYVLGVACRLLLIDKAAFWGDEWYTVGLTSLDWPRFVSVVAAVEANMILYYLALRAWLLLGDSEVFIRLLSVVFGVLSIGVVYMIGKRLLSRSVGLTAACLLAFNPFHIRYSQEARGYSLAVLLVTISAVFFLRAVERPSRRNLALWALFSSAAVYAQFFAILVPLAFLAALVFLPGSRAPVRRFLAAAAGIGILTTPMVLFLLTANRGQLAWIAPPRLRHLEKLFLAMTGGRLLSIAFLFLCAIALWFALRRRTATESGAWGFGLLVSWLLLPAAALFAVSFIRPLFVTRYLIVSLPPLLLLAAAGLCGIRWRPIYVGAMLSLAVLSGRAVWLNHLNPEKGERGRADWKTVANFVASQAQRDDAVMFPMIYAAQPVEYYWRKLPAGAFRPPIVFPLSWSSMQVSGEPREPGDALLRSLAERYRRVWIVSCRWYKDPERFGRVAEFFPSVTRVEFPDFVATLYSKDTGLQSANR